jgi:hypothetical protein
MTLFVVSTLVVQAMDSVVASSTRAVTERMDGGTKVPGMSAMKLTSPGLV